jgi:hypothetical protein
MRLTLGEVTIASIVEIDRSSFPTASMLPDSTAEGVARHFGWLKPHFFDERTGDIGTLILAAHFPRPGRIVRADGEHRFVPAEGGPSFGPAEGGPSDGPAEEAS